MTEPTLTELREMARQNLGRDDCWIGETVKCVLKSYLSLTDPTPLTPEHCPPDWVRDDVFQTVTSHDGGTQFDYHGDQRYLTICEATRGQLTLELMKEHRDVE